MVRPTTNALLAKLIAEVRGLRADLAQRDGQPSPDDANSNLLQEIKRAVGKLEFSSAELSRHATLPAAANLEAAIILSIGSLQPRRIGKALDSLQEKNFGGLVILRLGEDRNGAFWAVREWGNDSRTPAAALVTAQSAMQDAD